jgi:hypothetical protein
MMMMSRIDFLFFKTIIIDSYKILREKNCYWYLQRQAMNDEDDKLFLLSTHFLSFSQQ